MPSVMIAIDPTVARMSNRIRRRMPRALREIGVPSRKARLHGPFRLGPLLRLDLEQGVDERRDRSALGQDDKTAEQGHHDDHREEPELLAMVEIKPEFSQEAHPESSGSELVGDTPHVRCSSECRQSSSKALL